MALGRPAISEGSARDLRSTIAVLGAIRARIQALESSLGTVSDTATASSSSNSTQLNALRAQLNTLQSQVDALAAEIGNDDVVYAALEAINLGQGVVPLSDVTVGAADPSDPTRIFTVIGIALNSAGVGQAVTVRRRGTFTVPGASFAVNRAVYASATGLTQTPDYEVTALPIGVALTATQIYVEPDWPALQTPIFSSSGAEEVYERYMPVTYRLLLATLDLGAQIAALPYSSGIPVGALVPVEVGGTAFRVSASDFGGTSDLTAQILALPFSSGLPNNGVVPVEAGGVTYRVATTDLTNLGALIAALPFSSGADDSAMVPIEIAGIGLRVAANDIGNRSGTFTLASLAPAPVAYGHRWFDLSAGIEYTWMSDGNSDQWVEM
jgi:hypothetical protein